MRFYASAFQFDGIPSEMFGLQINEIDGSGNSTSAGSMNMNIIEKKIFRRPAPFFYGTSPSENLTFDVSFTSIDGDIDTEKSQLIQNWLFSTRTYKELYIIQPDMMDVHLNCIFNNPQIIQVGNIIIGYTATIVCDAPYGWNATRTAVRNYTGAEVDDVTFVFNNKSDDTGIYLYPIIQATMNAVDNGFLRVTNMSEPTTEYPSGREFQFMNLSAGEVLRVDNYLQEISSSSPDLRMPNFNKRFLRFIPGINRLRLQGNITKFETTYTFPSKV